MIAEADIEKTLKLSKATGVGVIPAKILKLFSNIVSPLTYIFNLSISTGIFVDDWKKVIPIYKSEDRKKCENNRPISVLPIISKVFEKEVFG